MESKKLKGVKTETLEVIESEVPRKKKHFSGTEEAEKQQPPPKLPLASSQKQGNLKWTALLQLRLSHYHNPSQFGRPIGGGTGGNLRTAGALEWENVASWTPLPPQHPFSGPAAPRGPCSSQPSPIYHWRTELESGGLTPLALLHPRLTLTPCSTVASPSPPGTATRPRRRRGSCKAPLPGMPHSVLRTNCSSTAATRLRSRTGVFRLEKAFRVL